MRYLGYASMALAALFPGYLAAMLTGSVIFGGITAAFLFAVMLYYHLEARRRGREAERFYGYEGREYAAYGSSYAGLHNADGGFGGGCDGGGSGGGDC